MIDKGMVFMETLIIFKRLALTKLDKYCGKSDSCYFLSGDFVTYTVLKNKFSNKCDILLLGKEFHTTISKIKESFLLLSCKIHRLNQSDIYWGSHLASRNSASIPLLRHLVYLQFAKQILATKKSRIVFICDSPALAYLIRNEAKKNGFTCQTKINCLDLLKPFFIWIRLIKSTVYFLVRSSVLWLFAKFIKNPISRLEKGKERYFIRTWLTAGCLNNQGIYTDRNFGVLIDYLYKNGKDVLILPMFFNLKRSILSQFIIIRKSRHHFILTEQLISYFDIIRAYIDGIKSFFIDISNIEFDGIDVSRLIKEVHLESCFYPELLSFNMSKYVIKKLKRSNVRIDRFIYPMENNVVEKSFILAAKRFYPTAEIIGFQHTVWYLEQLGMFLHPKELSCHPLPDKIVCSGKRYLDILQLAGFPKEIIQLGANLRFSVLPPMKTNECCSKSQKKKILIVLNFDINQALDLLIKVNAALKNLADFEIYIKVHPALNILQLKNSLKLISFPEYKSDILGTVQELASTMNVVIMSGGSVSNLEIISLGIPLLRVSMDNNFDFDPLWDKYPFSKLLSMPEEITWNLNKAFQINKEERTQLLEFGKKIQESYFEPITESKLRNFQ